jgi:hypothetical protein
MKDQDWLIRLAEAYALDPLDPQWRKDNELVISTQDDGVYEYLGRSKEKALELMTSMTGSVITHPNKFIDPIWNKTVVATDVTVSTLNDFRQLPPHLRSRVMSSAHFDPRTGAGVHSVSFIGFDSDADGIWHISESISWLLGRKDNSNYLGVRAVEGRLLAKSMHRHDPMPEEVRGYSLTSLEQLGQQILSRIPRPE